MRTSCRGGFSGSSMARPSSVRRRRPRLLRTRGQGAGQASGGVPCRGPRPVEVAPDALGGLWPARRGPLLLSPFPIGKEEPGTLGSPWAPCDPMLCGCCGLWLPTQNMRWKAEVQERSPSPHRNVSLPLTYQKRKAVTQTGTNVPGLLEARLGTGPWPP